MPAIAPNLDPNLATTAVKVDTFPVNATHLTTVEAVVVVDVVAVADMVDKAATATAVASLDTFLATALMAAAEAEVVADMEVETVNAMDAETLDTSHEIARIPTAAEVEVTMMRPTTDKQKKQDIFFSLCRDVM